MRLFTGVHREKTMLSATLKCQRCGWRTCCGQQEIERRLRGLGLLRRAPHPPEELVRELLAANLSRLKCDACGFAGLRLGKIDQADAPGDWQQVVLCQICNQPITPERLEVFPYATRCVDCQDASDRGVETAEPEFCPKCGSLLELRVSRGSGIIRYKQFCTNSPPCRL
jgi:Zn finger protein HypA/HybF involved in hydrogenase expression